MHSNIPQRNGREIPTEVTLLEYIQGLRMTRSTDPIQQGYLKAS
jgi:hypothetical protein